MAVPTTTTLVQYQGNGSTVTPYPTVFPFLDEEWLRVEVTAADGTVTELDLGLGFLASGAGDPEGGEVTTVAEVPETATITIYRIVPITQLLDLEYNDRLPATQLEQALDKLTFICQQLAGLSGAGGRSLNFPFSEPATHATLLPPPVDRRDTVLYFNLTTGEMEVMRLEVLAQRLLVILGADSILPYRTEEIADDLTLTRENVNSSIRANSTDPITITLPETSDFQEGFFCTVTRFGVGAVSFAGEPGVVIDSDSGKNRIFGQHTAVGVQLIGVNRWWIFGDLY